MKAQLESIMTSSGSPESEPRKTRGWGVIVLAGALVVVAVVIGVQVLAVLYGVLFPPAPPVLESFTESTHSSPSYGVDDWLYASTDDACRIVRFYQSEGASCRVAPGVCDAGFSDLDSSRAGVNVARCTGEIDWSIFVQRYYVNVAAGYGGDTPTRIRLEREIYWTGTLPVARE